MLKYHKRKKAYFRLTKVFKTDKIKPSQDVINECAEIMLSGGIAAFPTETVYGLGAIAFDASACEKIYTAKGRPAVKPLSCLVSSAEMAESISDVNETCRLLLKQFAPGPITIVLPKKPNIPDIVSAGTSTVAIRIPDNTIALSLIKAVNAPIAAPSANMSGMTSPKCAEDVLSQLNGRIDALIDGGKCDIGKESTIISLIGTKAKILRHGAISAELLSKFIEISNE